MLWILHSLGDGDGQLLGVAGIEPALDGLVLRCLATDPEDRYQTVAEIIGLLDQLAASSPWTEEQARAWWERRR